MEIKQIKNNKVNSFEFYYDLSKGEYLKKLLEVYFVDEIYMVIYGITSKIVSDGSQIKLCTKEFFVLPTGKDLQTYVLKTNIDKISEVFAMLGDNFDEIVVWNVYTNWESFVKGVNKKLSIFDFSRIDMQDDTNFYLDFRKSEFNHVEIISSLLFHNSRFIDKKDILDILTR